MNRWTALLFTILVLVAARSPAATVVTRGTDPTKHVLTGAIVTPDGRVLRGDVVIEGDTITCVAVDCAAPPGASRFTVTDAYIFPGFIDVHNHVAYNFLPKWTPPRLFAHRGLWQSHRAYRAFKEPYTAMLKAHPCEMVKWGEIAALMSGITSVQGTPSRTCNRGLVRNIENQHDLGLSADHIRTFILDITSFTGRIDWTKTRSFVVHIAEGIGETPRKEFDVLKQAGLLRAETAVAFGEAEFAEMGRAGTKLIWSPQSNLALYAETTNIPLALKHGVEVSLGVDWNPSGSDTLFDELRVAQQVDEDRWGHVIPADMWLQMVTGNPAKALAVDHLIGSIQPARKADITVLRARGDDPSASLLQTHLADVEMVWIGGELLYGAEPMLQAWRPDGCEALVVQGARKRLCTPVRPLIAALGQSFPWLVPVIR